MDLAGIDVLPALAQSFVQLADTRLGEFSVVCPDLSTILNRGFISFAASGMVRSGVGCVSVRDTLSPPRYSVVSISLFKPLRRAGEAVH